MLRALTGIVVLTLLLGPRGLIAQARDTVAVRSPSSQATGGPRLLVQNRYYAKPGKAEEVYAWRQHASTVLQRLGLQNGIALRGPGGNEPDAVWQIVLDSAVLLREARIAMEDPEFQSVMRHMNTLIRRFESGVYLQRRLQVEPDTTREPPFDHSKKLQN
jgi:hypothetical protein